MRQGGPHGPGMKDDGARLSVGTAGRLQRPTTVESGGSGPGTGKGGGVQATTESRAPSTLLAAIATVWLPSGGGSPLAIGPGSPRYRSGSTRMENSNRNRAASQLNSAQ